MAQTFTAKILLGLTPKMREALNRKAKQSGFNSTQDLLRQMVSEKTGVSQGKTK